VFPQPFPHGRGNLLGSGAQIAFRGDVVSVEDGTGLVPENLHRHSRGHATSDVVARCRAAEVVRRVAGDTSALTSAAPRGVEVSNALPVVMEDAHHDTATLALDTCCLLAPRP